jgi:hypothetical protein
MNMNKMFDGKKLMSRFFRPVDNVVWDLMTGRIGILGRDGITTIEGEGEDAEVTINLFDQFGVTVPAFAQGTATADVKVGDLIYGARGVLGWVVERTEKSFSILKPDGTRTNWSPPKVAMIGFGGDVMVLRSLINILPGGDSGLSNFQNLLMPMMLMGGDDLDLGQILPLMLMTQLGTTAPTGDGDDAANPLSGMANMMPMMLMMNMLGNKSDSNPFSGNYFDRGR